MQYPDHQRLSFQELMMMKFKNSDFLMAKRSKRAQKNKDRAGCMSGIVSIFAFRHGRITRQLLSDHGTHMTESTIGPSYPTSEVNSITDSEEMMHLWIESQNGEKCETTKTRVKELMEEEMHGVQECEESQEHMERTSIDYRQISKDEPVPSQYCHFEDLMNELLMIHQKKNEEQNPKSLERSNSLQSDQRSNPKLNDAVSRKNRNFFRRRSKSHECISFENDSPLPSNSKERRVSQFSFEEIKKKLKNAIGRSKRDLGEKPVIDGNRGLSSPGRDLFYSERFSRISNGFKIQDGVSRSFKYETKSSENDGFGDTSDRITNIYVEAKKHLSEILSNGDECTDLMVARHPRTLGKLLSFPNYDCSSPRIDPKNEPDNVVNESQPSVTDVDHQEPEVSDEVHEADDIIETVKSPSPEESEVFNALDLTEEDELSCSPITSPSGSSLPNNRKTEEVDGTSDDRTGKPSPVSVLEPLFSDDDISPARTITRSGETSIQPLRIRFEEYVTLTENQETCIHNHLENEESAFEYIEAVLLASDLNWDDFEKRWLSNHQILDQSLYEELQIFSSRPVHDQRLLFDSTNEILKEICDRSLGLFPGLPYFKPNIYMLPKGMKLINEVWERIESRLNCVYLRSLDQLVSNDMDISRMWMDLCLETREIVMEIGESVFEDMIEDTLLSLMDS
ncbi:hypothetical protein L2E82_14446 [Cichorium intybus]|uniref:Uncharacterized protein n=1 Tax=Cichorium intybus TaxID=13427 RepID=A0ACB9EZD8_CICIN|nr:hypothetical protein L2E82_14446 [Cichorium intybus]